MELEGKKPWSEPVIMEVLSDRYGWTPNQIREQSVEDIVAYLDIIEAKAKREKHAALRQQTRNS